MVTTTTNIIHVNHNMHVKHVKSLHITHKPETTTPYVNPHTHMICYLPNLTHTTIPINNYKRCTPFQKHCEPSTHWAHWHHAGRTSTYTNCAVNHHTDYTNNTQHHHNYTHNQLQFTRYKHDLSWNHKSYKQLQLYSTW